MDKAILESSLKILAFETRCDVILSCHDCKLEAHKVILSIASPIMRDLLQHTTESPALLIFPEVSSRTMSHILEYIYSGSARLFSKELQEFISIASLLEIHLDYKHLEKVKLEFLKSEKPIHTTKAENLLVLPTCTSIEEERMGQLLKNVRNIDNSFGSSLSSNEIINYSNKNSESNNNVKTVKKIPNLMPLSAINYKYKTRKGLYNQATPSPWCPRNIPLLASPRETDCLPFISSNIVQKSPLQDNFLGKNDSNNNFSYENPLRSLTTPPFNSLTVPTTTQANSLQFLHPRISLVPTTLPPRIPSPPPLPPLLISPTKQENSYSREDSSANESLRKRSDSLEETSLSSISKEPELKDFDEEEEGDLKSNTRCKQKSFKCQDCGKCFSQLRNFKYHRSIHEGTKEFAARCPECGKLFNDRGYLSSHLKIHRDRKEYACPHCPKRFNQRVAYNMHLRVHTGLKPHECPTCGKSFSRKMLLKQHQRVHTGERPYSCPECGKTFADRSNMSLHQRLHTGVKPYTCTLCPKSFTKKHHLKTHMNFHTGLKPYSCQNCGLAFSQSSNMRTHYKKCVLKSSNTSSRELASPDVC